MVSEERRGITVRVAGVVLCGGQSKRMGRPKAWLPFGNELMLQRVVRVIGNVLNPVVVVAAPGQDVPPINDDVRVLRDEWEGKGPLVGLASGLSALQSEADAIYLSACDVPFLTPAFVERVVSLLGNHSAAVPRVGGFDQPLAAAFRTTVLPVVQDLIAADRLRPTDLFEIIPTRVIEPHELPDLESLTNLNRPGDYEAALAELRP